jgi:hypothetical protein
MHVLNDHLAQSNSGTISASQLLATRARLPMMSSGTHLSLRSQAILTTQSRIHVSRQQARLSGGPGESYLDSTLVWHSTLIQTLREYVDTCG